ncbi:hypothetical protein N7490_006044 [Penicillium lividum]|nr:hypothetical protein N7490_006044 [Penicillium lividum]
MKACRALSILSWFLFVLEGERDSAWSGGSTDTGLKSRNRFAASESLEEAKQIFAEAAIEKLTKSLASMQDGHSLVTTSLCWHMVMTLYSILSFGIGYLKRSTPIWRSLRRKAPRRWEHSEC